MKKHLLRTAACALILGGLAACQSDDIVNPDNLSPQDLVKELDKRFDFSSYKTIPLSIHTSPLEKVSLYEINPETNPDAQPFFMAITNINGEFDINKVFPAHLIGHKIWAKTDNLVKEVVVNKKGVVINLASRDFTIEGLEGENGLCAALEKASDATLIPERNNLDILEHQMQAIDILPTSEKGAKVMVAAVDYGDQLYNKLYYYYYDPTKQLTEQYTYSDFVNRFVNDKYRLLPKETNPNFKKGDWTYEGWNGHKELLGKSTQLYYYGEDGSESASETFPKGTCIGFLLLTEHTYVYGADPENDPQSIYIKLTTGKSYKFNNPERTYDVSAQTWESANIDFNYIPYYAGAMDIAGMLGEGGKHSGYAEVSKYNNWLYTFEDNTGGGDYDMNDFKFLAVIDGDVRHSVPYAIEGEGSFKGYYCFEDLYPDQEGGDYDLNDVIVSYDYQYKLGQVITNLGTRMGVTHFAYNISPIHNGATYTNDFHLNFRPLDVMAHHGHTEVYKNHTSACQNPQVYSGVAMATFNPESGSFNGINSEDDEFAAGILFSNEDNIMGPKNKIVGDNILDYVAGIDPYIYCQNTKQQVHLSKFSYKGPNGGMGGSLIDHYLTNINFGEQYRYCPFAIDIPNCEASKFSPTPESVPIYQAFPRFVQWVESDGESETDWYTDTPIGAEE